MVRAHWSRALPVALAGLLPLAACQRVPFDQAPVPEDSSSGSGGGEEGGASNGGEAGGGFDPEFKCEPGDPTTCPEGQKCSALSNGGPQNKYQCVNDDGALLPGDDCTPSPGTGQDGCAAGSVCLLSDPDASIGRCLKTCRNDADCEPGLCTESPFTGTTFCADSCDPLGATCPQGLVCRQGQDRYFCGMAIEIDTGQNGDNCIGTSLRGCVENYACLPGALVPDCASGHCCTNTCDLDLGDEQCASPSLCRPLFSAPAPGFEGVGACFVPA